MVADLTPARELEVADEDEIEDEGALAGRTICRSGTRVVPTVTVPASPAENGKLDNEDEEADARNSSIEAAARCTGASMPLSTRRFAMGCST